MTPSDLTDASQMEQEETLDHLLVQHHILILAEDHYRNIIF